MSSDKRTKFRSEQLMQLTWDMLEAQGWTIFRELFEHYRISIHTIAQDAGFKVLAVQWCTCE